MLERHWYLKHCDLFQRLPTDQLVALESRCRLRKFPRGTSVYLPADQADAILLLTEGRIKIGSSNEDGKQTILALIDPGELFGELALTGSTHRDEFAEAAENSSVLLIPKEVMEQLLARNPELAMGITRLIGLRRRRIESRLKYLLFRSNRERLIHLLLELAEQYGVPTATGIELKVKLSHQDLASIIGSTRETVTVVLGELQSEGRIEVGRRKIVLTDVNFLAGSVDKPVPRLGGLAESS